MDLRSQRSGSVLGNTFIGGAYADVDRRTTMRSRTAQAAIYRRLRLSMSTVLNNNTMINTVWAAYGSVTDAIVEASWWCVGNLGSTIRTSSFMQQPRCLP